VIVICNEIVFIEMDDTDYFLTLFNTNTHYLFI